MDISEVSLSPSTDQTLSIGLPSGNFHLRLLCANVEEGGWIMDIADADGVSLAAGIPLVTGADLLEPYRYLGLGGSMFVRSDGIPDQVPTFQNLGVGSHLYFVRDA